MVVTATSATGTCQGPTNWSRAVYPPTVRSPMVMRNDLEPTLGSCNTRCAASSKSISLVSIASSGRVTRCTSRVMRGGLPSRMDISMSTGISGNKLSSTRKCKASVATPTTANGQRSRSQNCLNKSSCSGAIAST